MMAQETAGDSAGCPIEQRCWSAQMIRPDTDLGVGNRSPFLQTTLSLESETSDACLFISALGLYRCFINGQRVGDDVLTPGWTSYQDRLSYQTYPVGHLLRQGENTLTIWLGDGWYRSPLLWKGVRIVNTWGEHLGAIAEIRSGERLLAATGPHWQSGALPILKSGIYFGEIYDARLENQATTAGCTIDTSFDPQRLIAHEIAGVKELQPFPPVSEKKDEAGRTIYDFGQNVGGYIAFSVEGDAGAQILVEHSEILDLEGNFNNANYRLAEARIEYTLKGGGVEHYRPTFTFQGFRFARVTVSGNATIRSIASVPITSATHPTGTLSTANPLVNKLVKNTGWSQRGNFIEVPTDCPQRDERMGWSGDAQVFAPTACYLHDSHAFLVKWLRDLMADQRPGGEIPHFSPDPTRGHEDIVAGYYGSTGWGDAICIVPWVLWTHYGDKAILRQAFPAIMRWVEFVWSISNGPIVNTPRQWKARGFSFGDWLQPSGPTEKPFPTIGDDAAATIYLYISSTISAKIAHILGETDAERRMIVRAEAVKQAFAHEFIAPSGRLVYDDQTSYALAFLHDLIPEDKREAAKRYFRATIARSEGRIGTGFIGTPALLPALVKIGEYELAAAVFLQEEVPGWLYQIKMGATTIWERWDAIRADGKVFDPAMNSYNHYAYGSVCQWLFEGLAGFRPDPEEPAFRHIVFEPLVVAALAPLQAAHDSVAGRIEAGWSIDGNLVTYEITIPEGAHGSLRLKECYSLVRIDGQPRSTGKPGAASVALTSGKHMIEFLMAGLCSNEATK